MLILPAEPPPAGSPFERRHGDEFSLHARRLALADLLEREVADRLDEAIAQDIDGEAQGTDVVLRGEGLLSRGADRVLIDQRAQRDGLLPEIDERGGRDEIAIGVEMSGPQLGDRADATRALSGSGPPKAPRLGARKGIGRWGRAY